MAEFQTLQFDVRELDRYMGSKQYIIPTKSILDLQQKVEEWISMNECGAIIYGESRVGKTKAIQYISMNLKEKYGKELPIYILTATDHVPTQKTFYSSFLTAIGHEDPHKGTAVQMRQRLVNRIIANALDTKYRRAVLFVDEAYLFNSKEYLWLIDIYNELYLNDILFTVFLIGTKELKEQKTGYIRSGKKQIVLRFMVKEFEFMGITNKKEMAVCLASMDKPFSFSGCKDPIILSQTFFPEAYSDGHKLISYANELWEAFENVKVNNNISTNQILMKYFMDTIIKCMKYYGINGKNHYMPTNEDWIHCIIDSEFVTSQI